MGFTAYIPVLIPSMCVYDILYVLCGWNYNAALFKIDGVLLLEVITAEAVLALRTIIQLNCPGPYTTGDSTPL